MERIKERIKGIWQLMKRASAKYKRDDPIRLAGTTAYFTVFAMAPIVIIIISIFGILLGEEQIQREVYNRITSMIGEQGTEYVRDLVTNYQDTGKSITGTIIGFAVFIFTSTTFFIVLQKSLNFIWRIRAKPKNNLLRSFYDRLISLGMILSLGFVMLVSLLVDAGLAVFSDLLTKVLPKLTLNVIEIGNFVLSFVIIVLIFAMIYKFLPDGHIKWRVTWTGAIITAVLFVLGKYLIGLLIGATNIGVMYGAAGSLVIILLWVFYSSIIFFYGAEITQQYAEMYAHEIVPKDYAVKIEINELTDI